LMGHDGKSRQKLGVVVDIEGGRRMVLAVDEVGQLRLHLPVDCIYCQPFLSRWRSSSMGCFWMRPQRSGYIGFAISHPTACSHLVVLLCPRLWAGCPPKAWNVRKLLRRKVLAAAHN